MPSTRWSTYGKSHPAFNLQPQNITALWPVLISHPTEGRRLSSSGWLGEIPTWFARLKTVTHPSTSRGGRGSSSRPSLVMSRIDYCNSVLVGLPPSAMSSLHWSRMKLLGSFSASVNNFTSLHHTPTPFYSPFSVTTRVSQCQKRTSGLHGPREDQQRQTHWPSGWAPLHLD